MSDREPKKMFSFRLDADLVAFADNYADALGVNRTVVLEALLSALKDQRLWVTPDIRPNPFPGATRPEILPVRPFPTGVVPPGTYPHRYEKPLESAVPSGDWQANQEKEETHAS